MSSAETTASVSKTVLTEICDAIRAANKIALAAHVTPDADCLAVLGAMYLALPELGKYPYVSLPAGTVARRLAFLEELAGVKPATSQELAECDLALVMDTAKDRRVNLVGKLEAIPNAKIINIDHHASNTQFGQWNWVEANASSSSELIYLLLRALGCQITPTIATLIYAGIHSDTQGFSLSNATTRSLEIAHELARMGADIIHTCEKLNRSRSRSEFELLKVVYRNTQVSDDGKLAWSTADYDEIADAGCHANDVDDQVEVVRSIEGVRLAILFTEGNRGKIRMNFRGERGVSALALAKEFGGGGHHASAGAILDGTIEEITGRVIPAAKEYVKTLPD
ncbi:MAG: bifunctional oligoribonuclease/PAP phosphatase NrnA [Phycisphaerae bacterium]